MIIVWPFVNGGEEQNPLPVPRVVARKEHQLVVPPSN
jgi:hypothetical protein